jgi:hypothetical protein
LEAWPRFGLNRATLARAPASRYAIGDEDLPVSLAAAPIAPYTRLIAVITLGHGLLDCARILGYAGAVSPVVAYGPEAFWALVAFVLMRLIAAVGLWGFSIWGGVLVIAANGGELIFSILAPSLIRLELVGFAIRLLILVAMVLLLAFERYLRNFGAHEG